MERIYKSLLNIILFFIITGCYENTVTSEIEEIVIRPDQISEDFPISQLVKSLEYLPLETTDSSLVRSITKLIIDEGKYYIFDATQSTIFHFDNNGKYVRQLNRRGKGPGEYTRLSDVIQYKDNWIILDKMTNRLLRYDNSFNYVSELKIENIAYYFTKTDDSGYYLFTGGKDELLKLADHPYQLTKIDGEGTIMSHFSLIPENKIYSSYNTFTNDDGITGFSYPANDTVFIIDENTVQPRYKITFPKENEKHVFYTKIFHNSVYANAAYDKKALNVLYTKGETHAFRRFKNDIDSVDIPVVHHLHYMGKNKIIWSIEPDDLINQVNERRTSESLNKHDNYVLIIGNY